PPEPEGSATPPGLAPPQPSRLPPHATPAQAGPRRRRASERLGALAADCGWGGLQVGNAVPTRASGAPLLRSYGGRATATRHQTRDRSVVLRAFPCYSARPASPRMARGCNPSGTVRSLTRRRAIRPDRGGP